MPPVQFSASGAILFSLALLFCLLCVWYWRVSLRTLTDMAPARKRWALGLRMAGTALVLLALAGAQWVRPGDTLTTVFVVDVSRSITDAQIRQASDFIRDSARHKRANDRIAVVTFGGEPRVTTLPGTESGSEGIQRVGAIGATNIGAALDAAVPLVPPGQAGKIVVLSDGNENDGSALASAPTAAARGIRVDTVLLPSPSRTEALIEKIVAPARVKIGEPFSVRVITRALNRQSGSLAVWKDGTAATGARTVALAPGRQLHEFQVTMDQPGFHRLDADLLTNSAADSHTEDNKGRAYVFVQGRPQVLYVAETPARLQFLQRAMRAQNIDVHYVPPYGVPTSPAALQPYSALVLSNVSRDAFTDTQLTAFRTAVQDFGLGFAMVGGENSFGTGGYRKTPVEDLLPVSMEIRDMQRFPSVALALVVDCSGSMSEGAPHSKMEFAQKAAEYAATLLGPNDQVSVVAFTASASTVLPPTSTGQMDKIAGAIRSLSPGGGTSVIAGAEQGFNAIKGASAQRKHVIILTDGVSNNRDDFRPLAADMLRRGVSLTAVLVSAGTKDVYGNDLDWLSRETKGRLYVVDKPSQIPSIYMQEVEKITSQPLVEEPFTPRPGPDAPGADLPVDGLPTLLGYNATTLKSGAEELLVSHRSDPVLARWRNGLGRVAAFTSDDTNHWAAHWLTWGGYPRFWAQTLRWLTSAHTPADFQTQVTLEGNRGRISVDALDAQGRFMNRLRLEARVAHPQNDGQRPTDRLALRQTAPGHYEATFDAAEVGSYLVSVINPASSQISIASLVNAYSPEYRDLEPNSFLMSMLASAAGGRALSRAEEVFAAPRPTARTEMDLRDALLLAALLLLPFDIAVRRLSLQRGDVAALFAHLRGKPRRRETTTADLGRLLGAKQRVAAATADTAEPPAFAAPPPATARQPQTPRASAAPANTPPQARPAPPPEPAEAAPAGTPEGGMSRLLAAKRRARDAANTPDAASEPEEHDGT